MSSSATGLGIPQGLDVELFAQARVPELEFLDKALAVIAAPQKGEDDSGAGGLDEQAKALPRHMRRRATSHKPRRMSVALKNRGRGGNRGVRWRRATGAASPDAFRGNGGGSRGGGDVGVALKGTGPMGPENRCRKHRRRPRAMLEARSPHADAFTENAPARWLETHIWHAKRMHMKETWGFMLPAKSNRGPRAVSEACRRHCTVQDVTFLRPLEIRGQLQCILGVLSTVTDPLDVRPTQLACVKGFVESSAHLYRVCEFPLGCIAPVTVMWSPPMDGDDERDGDNNQSFMDVEDDAHEPRRVWLWVNPAAAKEALREIRKACSWRGAPWVSGVEAGPVAGGLCRLRVRGHRAHEIVQNVVRTAADIGPPSPAGYGTSNLAAAERRRKSNAELSRLVNEAGGGLRNASDSTTASADERGGDRVTDVDIISGDEDDQSHEAPRDGGFEEAARDNGRRWRLLRGEAADGRGMLGPLGLPNGSILALTVLDPRELSCNANAVTPRGVGPAHNSPAPRPSGADSSDRATGNQNVGGDSCPGRGEQAGRSTGSSAEGADRREVWPPRWAPVSPLWDPDARVLSARLAGARADHVINERRRLERARTAWDVVQPINALATVAESASSTAIAKSDRAAGVTPAAIVDRVPGGETPVILVASSGQPTSAHAVPGPNGFADDGRSKKGIAGEKQLRRKMRMVGAGWDIIVSAGWAPVFFHALVMAGARAISLADADAISLETGEARFPADYPDTLAGRLHWDAVGADLGLQWQRSRPKHRGFKLPSHQPQPPALPAAGGEETPSGRAPSPKSRFVPRASGATELIPSFRPDFRFLAGVVDPQATTTAHRQDVPRSSPPAMEEGQPTHTAAATITAAVVNDVRDPTKGSVPNKAEPEQEVVGMPGGSVRVDNETVGDARQISVSADPSGNCDDHVSENAGTSHTDDEDAMHEADHDIINVAASALEGGLVVDREPFALARGFHYCQAFLPPEGKGIAADAPPFPLNLAMPTMLSVKLTLEKGVPHTGMLIYAASPHHIELWEKCRRQKGGKAWPGVSSRTRNITEQDGSSSSLHLLPPPSRPIGAVTTGGFSFLQGCGVGRGACEAVAVRDALAASSFCGRSLAEAGGAGLGGRLIGGGGVVLINGRPPWGLVLVRSSLGGDQGNWFRPGIIAVTE